jgi:hypothetical protein
VFSKGRAGINRAPRSRPFARIAIYMDTFDAINKPRSVKAFDPTHRLKASEETKLLEAAIQLPTSFNMLK